MAQTDIDQLIDQLYVEDPKARRTAAKQLGELGKPEAIAELVNVYMKDDDPAVRKAAEDSLRIFRRVEQEMRGELGSSSGGALPKIRLVLMIALFATVLINVGLFISKSLPQSVEVTPTQADPTPRNELVKTLQDQINTFNTQAVALRLFFTNLQGMGFPALNVEANKKECTTRTSQRVEPFHLAQIDNITYPDLALVGADLDEAGLSLQQLENSLVALCGSTKDDDLTNQLNQFGGAAKLVQQVDEVKNSMLPSANDKLKKAIANPAPTVGPTFTPSPTKTPTPPPTDTPEPTSAETAVPPTAVGPTIAPTSAASATPTPLQKLSFNGLKLETLKSYKYKLTMSFDGTTNRAFKGKMTVLATRQTSPPIAKYEVNISESNIPESQFKAIAGPLYAPGALTYVALPEGVFQATLNKCQPGNAAALQDVNLSQLNDVNFTAVPPGETINGVAALHFHGEKKTGTNSEFLDSIELYITADTQVPVRIVINRTLAADRAKTATIITKLTSVLQYDLTSRNEPVEVVKPLICK
jgi:hypothetical protein